MVDLGFYREHSIGVLFLRPSSEEIFNIIFNWDSLVRLLSTDDHTHTSSYVITEDTQGWTLKVITIQMPAQPKPLIKIRHTGDTNSLAVCG